MQEDTSRFTEEALSEALREEMKARNIWKQGCPVSLDRLRLLTLTYIDFEQVTRTGQLMVLDAVASHVISIFKALYAQQFPIACLQLINHYTGDDAASMQDNNSSAFNHRTIIGGSFISLHAYGVAIDINPLQNPFITWEGQANGIATVSPSEGWAYLNRTNIRPGMVEPIVDLFHQHGFTVWGGRWNTPIDWQHFQTPRALAQLLAAMSPEDATDFFDLFTHHSTMLSQLNPEQQAEEMESLYRKNPDMFMDIFRKKTTQFDQSSPQEAITALKTMLS